MTLKDLWNKLDVVAVIGFLIAIETQISNGSMSLAHTLPEAWLPVVKEQAANLASLGGALVGIIRMAGNSSQPTSVTPTIVKILLAAFVLSFLLGSGSANAQTQRSPLRLQAPTVTDPATGDKKCLLPLDPLKLCGDLTGKPEEDMQRIVKRIQGIGRDDMNYAILKATTANTNGSKVRLQCLVAILAAKDAAEGTAIKDASGNVIPRPDPAVVTVIEDTAELVDALGPQGPLWTSCAGAAQLFKTNVLAVVNAFVTGAAGIAALPAGL